MTETAAVDPALSTTTNAPLPQTAGKCDVCGHPTAGHDRIAARFCDATQQNALSRSCICPSK